MASPLSLINPSNLIAGNLKYQMLSAINKIPIIGPVLSAVMLNTTSVSNINTVDDRQTKAIDKVNDNIIQQKQELIVIKKILEKINDSLKAKTQEQTEQTSINVDEKKKKDDDKADTGKEKGLLSKKESKGLIGALGGEPSKAGLFEDLASIEVSNPALGAIIGVGVADLFKHLFEYLFPKIKDHVEEEIERYAWNTLDKEVDDIVNDFAGNIKKQLNHDFPKTASAVNTLTAPIKKASALVGSDSSIPLIPGDHDPEFGNTLPKNTAPKSKGKITAGAVGGAVVGGWIGGAVGSALDPILGPFGTLGGYAAGAVVGGYIGNAEENSFKKEDAPIEAGEKAREGPVAPKTAAEFVKYWEGKPILKKPKPDVNDKGRGIIDIGYGHVIDDDDKTSGMVGGIIPYSPNMAITPEEAEALLQKDIPKYTARAAANVGPVWSSLSKSQQIALIDIAYRHGHIDDYIVKMLPLGPNHYNEVAKYATDHPYTDNSWDIKRAAWEGSFLKQGTNSIFHIGGEVPGLGEKDITVEGGEWILPKDKVKSIKKEMHINDYEDFIKKIRLGEKDITVEGGEWILPKDKVKSIKKEMHINDYEDFIKKIKIINKMIETPRFNMLDSFINSSKPEPVFSEPLIVHQNKTLLDMPIHNQDVPEPQMNIPLMVHQNKTLLDMPIHNQDVPEPQMNIPLMVHQNKPSNEHIPLNQGQIGVTNLTPFERFIVHQEGWKPKAYGNHIGAGHLITRQERQQGYILVDGEKISIHGTLTDAQIKKILRQDIKTHEATARREVGPEWNKLNDNQKMGLTDYVFNVGHLPKSILEAVKSEKFNEAAKLVEHSKTMHLGGLITRREEEATLIKGTDEHGTLFNPPSLRHDAGKMIVDSDRFSGSKIVPIIMPGGGSSGPASSTAIASAPTPVIVIGSSPVPGAPHLTKWPYS